MRDDFCAFILTHGRPDKVLTYRTLRRAGYTGKIFIVVDDEDKTRNPRQRVPKQRQNGQRILLMPYLWKMRVRRKKVWFSSVAPLTARLKRWLRHQKRLRR